MLNYTKLWILLEKRGMKRTDLKAIMSSATLAKLGKNEPVSSTVIEKVCDYLKCQPGDIMENITTEDMQKAGEVMNEKIAETINALSAATGMSKEAMFDNLSKGMADMLEALKNGETDIIGLGKIIDEKKQD